MLAPAAHAQARPPVAGLSPFEQVFFNYLTSTASTSRWGGFFNTTGPAAIDAHMLTRAVGGADCAAATQSLVALALERGGTDNATAVVIAVDGSETSAGA